MKVNGLTHIGKLRESNQDKFLVEKIDDKTCLAIVCDGMGGQSGGDIASSMACRILYDKILGEIEGVKSDESIKELLVVGMSEANSEIYKVSNIESGCKGMGTTAVAAIIHGDHAYIAHVGDSRVYMLTDKKISQVTKDHSLVQELLDQGKITKKEVFKHPDKNMITRAVGVYLQVNIDYLEFSIPKNSKLLICTDGLTNMVLDDAIAEVLVEKSGLVACETLIELANDAGGFDNITVAIVE